jgi:hypothetical protein
MKGGGAGGGGAGGGGACAGGGGKGAEPGVVGKFKLGVLLSYAGGWCITGGPIGTDPTDCCGLFEGLNGTVLYAFSTAWRAVSGVNVLGDWGGGTGALADIGAWPWLDKTLSNGD